MDHMKLGCLLLLFALVGTASAASLRKAKLAAKREGVASDCLAFFDQGGGSFTSFMFSSPTKQEAKAKSKDMLKGKESTVKWVNSAKGTFDDYSKDDASTFPAITSALAGFYNDAVGVMTGKASGCKVAKVVIRQTGKIREALLTGARKADRNAWDDAMVASLKKSFPATPVDYQLLPNAEEADMEGKDFFEVKFEEFSEAVKGVSKDKVIAAGIGSSSTQVYTLVGGKVVANGDSKLGALPPKGTTKDTKFDFDTKWNNIIKASFNPSGKTLVAMNAVGYGVQGCVEALKDHAKKGYNEGLAGTAGDVEKAVLAYTPVKPGTLKTLADACATAAGDAMSKDDFTMYYQAKMLSALAKNMRDKGMSGAILECKFTKKCGLPGGASWATYVIKQAFPKV